MWREHRASDRRVGDPVEDIRILRTPVPAPRANAIMEHWFGSLRRECLYRLLLVGRRHVGASRSRRPDKLQVNKGLRRPQRGRSDLSAPRRVGTAPDA
jgi:hypothetical protein